MEKSEIQTGEKQGKPGRIPPKANQFKPGESGNPNGRPKGTLSITKYIREALEAQDDKQAKQLAAALILQAAKGNGSAINQVLSRIDGVLASKTDITSDGEKINSGVVIYIPSNGREIEPEKP